MAIYSNMILDVSTALVAIYVGALWPYSNMILGVITPPGGCIK